MADTAQTHMRFLNGLSIISELATEFSHFHAKPTDTLRGPLIAIQHVVGQATWRQPVNIHQPLYGTMQDVIESST